MGYEIARFLVTDIDKDLMCPICMSVLENPVETPCEHAFCRGCILQWLERRRRCPLDQTVISRDHLCRPSRLLTNQLARLEVRCEFRDRGCTQTMPLELEPAHRLKCPCNPRDDKEPAARSPVPLQPRHGQPLASDDDEESGEDLGMWAAAAVGAVGLAGIIGTVAAGLIGYQRGKNSRRE